MTRLSEELHGTLDEAGLSAAERKAGKVDARKMSEKEVLGLLADGKQVVVTKKMAHKVPALLQKHDLAIRSFWAGPRSEWHGLALVGSKEKAAKLKASLGESLEEAVAGVNLRDLPNEIQGVPVFIENMEEWVKETKGFLKSLAKAKTSRDRQLLVRHIAGNLGTMQMEAKRVRGPVLDLFGRLRKEKPERF
jgi:hypothetical protein